MKRNFPTPLELQTTSLDLLLEAKEELSKKDRSQSNIRHAVEGYLTAFKLYVLTVPAHVRDDMPEDKDFQALARLCVGYQNALYKGDVSNGTRFDF